MFGHDWQPGQATIVAVKEVKSFGSDARTGAKLQEYEYVADVQPDAPGSAFRIVMGNPFDETHWVTPRVGDVLPVKCDTRRQKAKFDTSGLSARAKAQKNAAKQEQEAQFEAARNAPPGSGAPSPGADADLAGDMESAVAGNADASGASRPWLPSWAAIQQAKASGNRAELDRLRAEFLDRALQNAGAAGQAPAGLTPQPVESDPVERLRALAELHDRGDLTDAEFASAKAKILSQE